MTKQLVWNSKDYSREHILVHCNITSIHSNRIIDKILPRNKTERLVINNKRYLYNPSEEYKTYILKFKRNN